MGWPIITWEEIYDYLRCPKIPAFKAMGLRARRIKRRKRPKVAPYRIGKLGEKLAEAVIPTVSSSESVSEFGRSVRKMSTEKFKEIVDKLPMLKKRIDRVIHEVMGKPLEYSDHWVKEIVKRDVVGLVRIASKLSDEFGEVGMAGSVKLKSPTLPTYGNPDLIFTTGRVGHYLIAEVKNVEKIIPSHRFQAIFYNTVAKLDAFIMGVRITHKKHEFFPEVLPYSNVSTVLLFPRQGKFERINKRLDMSTLVQLVWESILLGMMGKQPEAAKREYCSVCPWKKFCSNWTKNSPATGSIDIIPKPLPLIYVNGVLASGFDIDLYTLYHECRHIIWGIEKGVMEDFDYRVTKIKDLELQLKETLVKNRNIDIEHGLSKLETARENLYLEFKNRLIELVAELFRIKPKDAQKIIQEHYKYGYRRFWFYIYGFEMPQILPSVKTVFKEMSNEIEPWSKIIRKFKKKVRFPSEFDIRHSSIITCMFPKNTKMLVRKAWRRWK